MTHHKSLAAGQWAQMTFFNQMANIGSEVERAANQRGKDKKNFALAIERALELIDLTIDDTTETSRLKELCRLREVVADYYFDNTYRSSLQNWRSYFYPFILAARK